MKALLICPADRPAVAALAEAAPLALLPVLGKKFIEHWLEHLASLGAKYVRILAPDRPDQVRHYVGDGARWGMRIDVLPEVRELSPDEARSKYQTDDIGWLPRPSDVILADHLPGLEKLSLWTNYRESYCALMGLLERKAFSNYIGVREVRPGVWVGRHARIAPTAVIEAPCWVGANAWIGEHARIGPMSVIEDGAFIDARAVVHSSLVGPATYVGRGTELRSSFALGNILINWRTNGVVAVPERFLLCALSSPKLFRSTAALAARLAAFVLLALTLPLATCIALRSWLLGQPAFRLRKAVRPRVSAFGPARAVLYYELTNTNRFWRRWPQLWNVFRGDFAWVGNRPLTALQAGRLTTEFDRLWLAAPIGLVSLADAEGCFDALEEDARAHAAFLAARPTRRLKRCILRRVIAAAILAPAAPRQEEAFPVSLPKPVIKESRL